MSRFEGLERRGEGRQDVVLQRVRVDKLCAYHRQGECAGGRGGRGRT